MLIFMEDDYVKSDCSLFVGWPKSQPTKTGLYPARLLNDSNNLNKIVNARREGTFCFSATIDVELETRTTTNKGTSPDMFVANSEGGLHKETPRFYCCLCSTGFSFHRSKL